jgi:trehalose 6-phosphate synthase/phosphatase
MNKRLVIVSCRLPVTVQKLDDRVLVQQSAGGIATGLQPPHQRSGGVWIGWPGDLESLEPDERRLVQDRLDELRLVPIALEYEEVEAFYERIANGVLWPTFHDRLDRLPLRIQGWRGYEDVNHRFSDATARLWKDGDLVWVHDYQLMLVPEQLRKYHPGARIGFFLHIPFPAPQLFATLPFREDLLRGVLGADVVGFHTRSYRESFLSAARWLLGAEISSDGTVALGDRRIRTGVFPMGIDAGHFAERASSLEVSRRALDLRRTRGRLLLGIDRLDYSKGIPRRLLSVERLLSVYPEWRSRVRFVQVAVPSRGRVGAYRRFRSDVEELVGRINGQFATPDWTPIHYLHRSISDNTLVSLYRAADVMLVTPVRDGMNLVSKEFVATRVDGDGVLVLSEFAGAAETMTDALLVNPYDVDQVADAIHLALTMDAAERRRRMQALRSHVLTHDVHSWTASFLKELEGDDGQVAAVAAD